MTEPARVVVLTPDELEQLVERAIARAVAARGPADDDWMGPDEVARILRVERGTLPSLVRRDGLPCYRPGRGYVFRRSEVVAWLEARAERPRSHAGQHGTTLRALRGGT